MDDLQLVDPALLPPRIKRLIAIIGLPETFLLLQRRGGVPCYIPTTIEHSQQLKAILQPESIAALAKSDLAGQTIELPKDDKIVKQLRNLAIRAAVARSNKIRTARDYKLSRRQVINICQSDNENPTPDLFGKTGSQ
ncbi:MAG: hypothetical protein HY272_01805 [Gammaproteobacteria bacterium]|nr:hypothetical protein [Gammaproteobacteria bacterium]